MKKVVTIGGATQDIFIYYDDPQLLRLNTKKFIAFEEDTKIEINNLNYSTGGGATNTATSFSRLGFQTSTIFKIGLDCQADLIIKKLIQENVNTSYITQSKKLHTGLSIIIPSSLGERTVLAYRGANTDLKKQDIDLNLIKNTNLLYITSLSGQSSKLLPYITYMAKKYGIPIATNPGISQLATGIQELIDSLPNIDIFILNKHEAMQLMCSLSKNQKTQTNFNLQNYFHKIITLGPKTVVVTDGAHGVYVAHDARLYFHPSLPPQISPEKTMSTLGAGDSFGSCFVASITSGLSIPESMIRGIINSSSVLSYLDAKTGLLNKEELDKKTKKITEKHITQTPLVSLT